jgi:hypothetical protein
VVTSIDRLAGVGGLAFVVTLVVQNILRANAPSFNATPSQVTDYFSHHHTAAIVPLGLFPVGMLAIFVFVAGMWTRASNEESRSWASVGALGATALAGLFAMVNITEIVLTAKSAQLAPSSSVIQALWTMHAAAFGLDLAAIAVTLIGLSKAAASSSLLPAWITVLTMLGAACLLIAAVFTVALANGGPWLTLGLVGFVVWIAFVVAASVALLRGRQIS